MKRSCLLLLLLVFILGCDCKPASNPENVAPYQGSNVVVKSNNDPDFPKVIDYQNGVYYFNCRQAEFGNILSAWRLKNPEKKIVAVANDGTGGYGSTIGYFVIVEILAEKP